MTRVEQYAAEIAARGLVPVSPMAGAGDVIARATAALGIKTCGGCEQRRVRLNQLFPFAPRTGEGR